MILQLKLQLLT